MGAGNFPLARDASRRSPPPWPPRLHSPRERPPGSSITDVIVNNPPGDVNDRDQGVYCAHVARGRSTGSGRGGMTQRNGAKASDRGWK